MKKYRIIYADPPWDYGNSKKKLENNHNIEFINASYDEFNPNENDFCYYGPPYANTKGMYFGAIDNDKFFNFLSDLILPHRWIKIWIGRILYIKENSIIDKDNI